MGYNILGKLVDSASMESKLLNKTAIKILRMLKRRLPKENQTSLSYKMVLEEAIIMVDKIDFDRIKL